MMRPECAGSVLQAAREVSLPARWRGYIIPVGDALPDGPVYAINWFNPRSLWLYNFYNFLAARSVTAVGGRAIFKGVVTKSLSETKGAGRRVLLIVRYPSVDAFAGMLTSSYFQIVSLLRLLAVKDFSFCFTEGILHDQGVSDGQSTYGVLLLRGAWETFEFRQTLLSCRQHDIVFAGRAVAHLAIGDGETSEPITCPLDQIVVVKAAAREAIEQQWDEAEYRVMSDGHDPVFAGLIDRLI